MVALANDRYLFGELLAPSTPRPLDRTGAEYPPRGRRTGTVWLPFACDIRGWPPAELCAPQPEKSAPVDRPAGSTIEENLRQRVTVPAIIADVEEIQVRVARRERATLRVGDVFLKVDVDHVTAGSPRPCSVRGHQCLSTATCR
jgi:hypothetical protein